MTTFLFILFVLAVAFHLYRRSWITRALPPIGVIPFAGTIYKVNETVIGVLRPEGTPSKTVICFPGFTENHRYFIDQYAGTDYELILMGNSTYHSPLDEREATALDWPKNPFYTCTVEHDAFLLAHALKELATTDRIVIHGHSRGAAVTLDAARQFPDLMKQEGKQITALLECPAVPQAVPSAVQKSEVINAITRYLLPLFFVMLRNASVEKIEKMPMMQPTTPLKTELVRESMRAPKRYKVYVDNAHYLNDWMDTQKEDLYGLYEQVKVVLGERDDVLRNDTIRASAEKGKALNEGVEIIETKNTNHFVGTEKPEVIRSIVAAL